MIHNILYISYHYPPSNSVAANRSFSQVTALRALGHRVKVIHASNDDSRYIINIFHQPHEDDHVIEINRRFLKKTFNKSSSFKHLIIKHFPRLVRFIQQLRRFFFHEEKDWDTKNNFEMILKILNGFKPDLVISTSGPIENHSLGSKLKRLYRCFWVAEYRDPWSYNPMMPGTNEADLGSKICRIKESKIINTADLILAVNSHIKDYYEKFFNKSTYLIFSGWMDSDITVPEPKFIQKNSKKKNILHLGSLLLGNRSPIPLIDLFEESSYLRENYNMYFIGRDTNLFHNYLKNTTYAKSSFFLEKEVSFLQSRSEGINADILLMMMMNHPAEKYSLPGKLYEYIFCQKPIIILDSQASEASQIVINNKLGHVCNSVNELQDLLFSIKKDKDLIYPSNSTRDKFNTFNAMSDFMQFLNLSFFKKP